MQQGMLSSVLLSIALLTGVPTVAATEMEPQRVEQWLQESQVHDKVAELLQYVVEDDTDGLNFALQRLSLPVQEVSRYLLLKKIEDQKSLLSPSSTIQIKQKSPGSRVRSYQNRRESNGPLTTKLRSYSRGNNIY